MYLLFKEDGIQVSICDEELQTNKDRFQERQIYSLQDLHHVHIVIIMILVCHPYRMELSDCIKIGYNGS